MLAIGGIHQNDDDQIEHKRPSSTDGDSAAGEPHHFKCPVHMCEWSLILKHCKLMERELAKLEYPTSQSRAHRRILRDMIQLFAVHNFQAGTWYEETLQRSARLGVNPEASSLLFRSIHKQFKPPLQTP